MADPNWVPLAVTPGHPEYPAAHGCVTAALMDTLTAYFDTEEMPYTVTSTVTSRVGADISLPITTTASLYATLHPEQPYIVYNDLPKIDNLKRLMPDVYREKPVLVSSAAASN